MKRLWLAGLLLFAACSRPERPVKVVSLTTLSFYPFRFAHELGHFRAEGLQVELEEIVSGPKAVQAVLGGSADIIAVGVALPIMLATTGGRLKTFYTLSNGDRILLIVSANKADSLRSVADLKGAKIGVGGLGGWQERVLAFYLARAGLKASNVHVIGVGLGAAAVAAVEHNKVDAALVPSLEFASIQLRVPAIRILIDPLPPDQQREVFGVDAWPDSLGLSATPKWLAEHPDEARRLTRAMNRTVCWIKEQPPEQILVRLPLQLREEERPVYLEQLKIVIGMLSKDGRMPPGGPEVVRRILAASMESVKSVDLASTWTDEFLEEK